MDGSPVRDPADRVEQSTNRFANADSLDEVIDQLAAGAAPWGFGAAGTEPVDAEQARQIADAARERVVELGLTDLG